MSLDNKNFEEELDFKKVKDNPIRWFGLVYPFFLFVIVAIGLYYLTQIDVIERNRTQSVNFDSVIVKTDILMKKGAAVKGIELALVKVPNEAMMENAKNIFISTCSACHGNDGMGDGAAGAVLNPKPRNFHKSEGWTNGRKLSEVFKTIQEGISGTGMTGYDYLETDVKIALAHYVRAFGKESPAITENELKEMNAIYKLTEDRVTSNQIPVDKAIELLDKENSGLQSEIKKKIEKVKSDNTESALILKSRTNCLVKAFTLLSNSESWKQNTELFAQTVFYGAPANGFCPSITDLKKDELFSVYSYLKVIFN